ARALLFANVVPNGPSLAFQNVFDAAPNDALDQSADLSALLLPWLDPPAFDTTTGEIRLQASGTSTVDVVLIEASYQRDVAPSLSRQYDWRVIAPQIESVKLPALPASLDLLPKPSDANVRAQAFAYEWSAVSDYSTLKKELEARVNGLAIADPAAPITRVSVS